MMRKLLLFSIFLLFCTLYAAAQKSERNHLRSGNRHYRDSLFQQAETDYRRALDVNPQSTEAMFNLGNTLLMNQNAQDAMKEWERATHIETDKNKLAKLYHNMGVVLQASKQYAASVEMYKQALRNNPHDDETRYNLALAQYMLKNQQDQQQDNQQQQDKQDEQKEQKDEQQQQDQQDEQQDNQPQQQPQNEQKEEMSKENAEQLLNAVMQDEKDVQEKRAKQYKAVNIKIEKDW